MTSSQMSVLQLCKNLLLCRKKENPKPFKLTILPPSHIFTEFIRRKQEKEKNIFEIEGCEQSYSLSYSSPNLLYSQVYENNTLKPKISIKYKQFENNHHRSWDQLESNSEVLDDANVTNELRIGAIKKQNQNDKFHYECFSNESSLTSEPEQPEQPEQAHINQESRKTPQRKFSTKARKPTRNKRHFSLKHRKLKATPSVSLKQHLSCPDLSKIIKQDDNFKISHKGPSKIDFIDDFTNELFKDDLNLDDDFDLLSINFE